MIWSDGEFKDSGCVFDINNGIRLGHGVFDTMLAIDGRPIQPLAHFSRLIQHASDFYFETSAILEQFCKLPKNQEDLDLFYHTYDAQAERALQDITKTLLERNNLEKGDALIRTILTKKQAGLNAAVSSNSETPPLITMQTLPVPVPPKENHAVIVENTRRNELSPLSQIKSCNYGDNILAQSEAEEKGCNVAILLNTRDNISCAANGNIFVCLEDEKNKKPYLATPPKTDGVIEGVMRKRIFDHYNKDPRSYCHPEFESPKDIVKIRSISKQDLLEKNQGIYLTNSIRGIVRLDTLNGKKIPKPAITIEPKIRIW